MLLGVCGLDFTFTNRSESGKVLAVKSLHLPRNEYGAWLGIGTNVTVEAFTEFDEFYSGSFLPGNPNVLTPIVIR